MNFRPRGTGEGEQGQDGWMDGWFVCGAVSVEGAKRHSSGNKGCKTEMGATEAHEWRDA